MNTLFAAITTIPDKRKGNRLTYPLDYILLVVFTAVMFGFALGMRWSYIQKLTRRT